MNPVYLVSAVASVCAFYFVWSVGIRKLLLDSMRERLFELRFEMFRLGMNGELSFDNDAYRSLETLFNGLLRFGHRISFLTWVFSTIEIARAKREDKDYVSVSSQIGLKVSRLNPETQTKIARILNEVHRAAIRYMAFSSLLFLCIAAVLSSLEALGLMNLDSKKKSAREVIEREAYVSESRRGPRLAAA
jgi:hypothetical protein